MKQFFAVALAAVASAIDYPGDYCCTLYGNWYLKTDYGTKTLCISESQQSKWFNLRDERFDNKMYSYWCGAKIYAEFNYNYPYDYRAEDYGFTSAGNIQNGDVWLQGNISAVKLQKYDEMNLGAVTLFEKSDCHGQNASFFAHENPDYAKVYTSDDMWQGNMWHKWTQAVRVPYGYVAEFEPIGGGTVNRVEGKPHVDYGEYTIAPCQQTNFPTGKLTVRRSEKVGPVQCGWSGQTGSSTMDFEISSGMTSTDSSSTTTTNSHTMDYSLNAGIEIEGVSMGGSTGESWTDEVSKNIQQTYSSNTQQTVSFTCEGDDGVGLWQFYCDSYDGTVSVMTLNTVCRTGPGIFNTPPACPWNACKNADCTECHEGWAAGSYLALASKVEEVNAQEEESSSNIYFGVAFGVIGAIAAGALINNCNKKRINPNKEKYLEHYQRAAPLNDASSAFQTETV